MVDKTRLGLAPPRRFARDPRFVVIALAAALVHPGLTGEPGRVKWTFATVGKSFSSPALGADELVLSWNRLLSKQVLERAPEPELAAGPLDNETPRR